MTDRAAIEALIKRLKHAHIGSAELDLAIESAIGEPRSVTTPAWSRSIDAALTLVLGGWQIKTIHWAERVSVAAGQINGKATVFNTGATAALAICQAALRIVRRCDGASA